MSISADVPQEEQGEGLDAAEFATLYARHRDSLRQYCRKRINDPAALEDIVQDVFEKAFANRRRFDREREFWPWLVSIAARVCIDFHRRAVSAAARDDRYGRETHRDPFDVTAATVLEATDHSHIGRHIAALPPTQRSVLELFALDDWSYQQIGSHLGCSTPAVKAAIRRARATLRETVERWVGVVVGVGRLTRRRVEARAAWLQGSLMPSLDAVGLSTARVMSKLATVAVAVAAALVCGVLVDTPSSPPADALSIPVPPPELSAQAAPIGRPATRVEPTPSSEGTTTAPPPRRPLTGAAERAVVGTTAGALPDNSTNTDPEWMQAASYAASPNYEHEPSVFVLGETIGRRGEVGAAMVATHDDGASWRRVPAIGLSPFTNRLLLPPAYPRDNRLFAVSPHGVQASYDGGGTFQTLAALAHTTDAALSPRFDDGDPTILLVAGGRAWQYDDSTGIVAPVVVEGEPSTHVVTNVGYAAGTGGDDIVILGSQRPYEWDGITRFVSRCTKGIVSPALPGPRLECVSVGLPKTGGTELPVRVPLGSRSGPIVVSHPTQPWISTDGGRTFRPARASMFDDTEPHYYNLNDMAPISSSSGQSAIAAQTTTTKWPAPFAFGPQLARTDDGGRRWTAITVTLPRFSWARSVVVTPTGRIIAGSGEGGLACSADGGRTWGRTCPAP